MFNYCISNENDQVMKFYSVLEGAAGSLHKDFSHTASDLNNSYDVKTKTIDQVCEDEDIIPDFVKIDVEGHEYIVLEQLFMSSFSGVILVLVWLKKFMFLILFLYLFVILKLQIVN